MAFYDKILYPIMIVVSYILVGAHKVLSLLLDPDSGVIWVLSIIILVLIMRICMIPLFVKQIKSSRNMQIIQPQMMKIQKKYKGKTDQFSKQRQQQEIMALYKEAGTSPFSSCLPILVQSPFFFALFRVLQSLTSLANGEYMGHKSIGLIDKAIAQSASKATLFGAQLSGTFAHASEAVNPTSTKIVTIILVVLMCSSQFFTTRQLTMQNMPKSALDNPMAKQQKTMMYLMPLVFVFSGFNFPLGVLVYWFTTNVWSMGQQYFVIKRMPAPGSKAEQKMKERQKNKKRSFFSKIFKKNSASEQEQAEQDANDQKQKQRKQPKRKNRASRNKKQRPTQASNL
jgi:YidC/Oxa1 family membrane protein insertase